MAEPLEQDDRGLRHPWEQGIGETRSEQCDPHGDLLVATRAAAARNGQTNLAAITGLRNPPLGSLAVVTGSEPTASEPTASEPTAAGRSAAPSRTYEVILHRIEQQLGSGELAVGDRIPAERTLAEQLRVSRPSVREAVKVLEALGVLEVTGGQGRDSGAVVVARPGAAIGAAMRLHVATRSLPIADLVETRVLLEVASMRRLGVRVTGELDDVALLAPAEQILLRMADQQLPPAQFHQLDTAFHVALAQAAGNVVVEVMMVSLREAIEAYVLAAVPDLPDWSATADGLRVQHAAVLAALRAGDGDLAAARVEQHIRGFFAVAQARRNEVPAGDGPELDHDPRSGP
jgi:GntR family transcriptional repressor for pyruvate dehydrogenase complex